MAIKKLTVEQDPEKPIEKKVLAQAIVDISSAMLKLFRSGLNRKAIIILTAQSSGHPQYVVGSVLDALESLKKDFTSL